MPTSTTYSRSHTGILSTAATHRETPADRAPATHAPHAPHAQADAGLSADPSGYLAQLFGGIAPRARTDSQSDLLRELIDGLTDGRAARKARDAHQMRESAGANRRAHAHEDASHDLATRERAVADRERDASPVDAGLASCGLATRVREGVDASDHDAHRATPAPATHGLRAWLAPLLPMAPMRCLLARVAILVLTLGAAAVSTACRDAADPNVIRMNGTLEAPLVDLAPKVTGRVTEVLVREGDRVKAGDLLIKFDIGETAIAVDRDRAAVASAQARAKDLEAGSRQREIAAARSEVTDRAAAVALAKKELERQQYLLSRKVGTERDLDRARTDLERTEATLKISRDKLQLTEEGTRVWQKEQARTDVTRAEAQLRQSETVAAEAELRAPANAIVTHRIAEPGLLVAAGQAALTLSYTDRLYVRTFIPEPQLGRVKQGIAAEVTVDAFPGRTFPARISEISPRAEFTPKAVETREERVNLVYASKVDLNNGWNEPLVPGQPAEVVVRIQSGGNSGSGGSGAAAPPSPSPAQPASSAQPAQSAQPTSSTPAAPAARPQE